MVADAVSRREFLKRPRSHLPGPAQEFCWMRSRLNYRPGNGRHPAEVAVGGSCQRDPQRWRRRTHHPSKANTATHPAARERLDHNPAVTHRPARTTRIPGEDGPRKIILAYDIRCLPDKAGELSFHFHQMQSGALGLRIKMRLRTLCECCLIYCTVALMVELADTLL